MSESSVRRLVGLPVRAGAQRLGIVDDLVLGADLSVVLGLVVEAPGGRRWFLPWPLLDAEPDCVDIRRRTSLLGEGELGYYLSGGVRLGLLLGLGVETSDGDTAILVDVLAEADGRVRTLALAGGGVTRAVPLDATRIRWSAGRLLEVTISPVAGGVP